MEKSADKIFKRAKRIKEIVDERAKQNHVDRARQRRKEHEDSVEKFKNTMGVDLEREVESFLKISHEQNMEYVQSTERPWLLNLIKTRIYRFDTEEEKAKFFEIYHAILEKFDRTNDLSNNIVGSGVVRKLLELGKISNDPDIKKNIKEKILDISKKYNISLEQYDDVLDLENKDDRLFLQNVYLNQAELGYKGKIFSYKMFDLNEEDEKDNLRRIVHRLALANKVKNVPESLFDLNDVNQKLMYYEIQIATLSSKDGIEYVQEMLEKAENDETIDVVFELTTFYSDVTEYMDFLAGKPRKKEKILTREDEIAMEEDTTGIIECSYMFEKMNKLYTKIKALVPDFTKESLIDITAEATIKKQKSILLDVLDVLKETGCLDDLIKEQKIGINDFLPDGNKIENYKDADEFIEYVANMDEDIRVPVYLRHFTNKLSHNIEDFGFFVFYSDVANNTDNIAELKQSKKDEIDYFLRNANREDLYPIENILIDSMYMKDVGNRREEHASILKVINKNLKNKNVPIEIIQKRLHDFLDVHYQTDDKILTKVLSIYFKQLEEVERKYKTYNKDNGIRCDSFSFSEFLNVYLEKEVYDPKNKDSDYRKIFEEKFIDHPEILTNLDSVINALVNDDRFYDKKTLIKTLAEYMDIKAASFQVKQLLNLQLAQVAKKSDEIIYQNSVDRNGNGVVDVAIPGHIQVFGSHYKLYESEFVNQELEGFPKVDSEIEDVFYNSLSDVSVQIPFRELTDSQKEYFKKLSKVIYALELGEEVNKDDYNAQRDGQSVNLYQELEDLKNNDENKYKAYRLQILIGSGIDTYKDYMSRVHLEENKKDNSKKRNTHEELEDNLSNEDLVNALSDSQIGDELKGEKDRGERTDD